MIRLCLILHEPAAITGEHGWFTRPEGWQPRSRKIKAIPCEATTIDEWTLGNTHSVL